LDLNYTLVENSTTKVSPFSRQIEQEVYRAWLVDLLRDRNVIMLTARPAKYRQQTLESLLLKTGWRPGEAHFNEDGLRPPLAKRAMLERLVFPVYGRDAAYFALESNPQTRAMYREFGIDAITASELQAAITEADQILGPARPSVRAVPRPS
jgi:hypothetical protein